jgi:hypothetical protein
VQLVIAVLNCSVGSLQNSADIVRASGLSVLFAYPFVGETLLTLSAVCLTFPLSFSKS